MKGVSEAGDRGIPYALVGGDRDGQGGKEWKSVMEGVAERVWERLASI